MSTKPGTTGKRDYLGGRYSPDLEVVRPHEQVGNAGPHHANNPLIEVLGFGIGYSSFQGCVDHAVHTIDLFLLGQHRDVVLEGVWNPEIFAADVGNSLVGVPVLLFRQCLVDAVIEVAVMGEYDVSADVVQLERRSIAGQLGVQCS